MSIGTAQAKILAALSGLSIDCIDDAKTIRPEGMLLSFEGMHREGFSGGEYTFGLYVSKKILNKKTETIYSDLDEIAQKIVIEAQKSPRGNEIALKNIRAIGFDNGILEYRVEIHILEI